jgi:GntR family transcriptional regulator
MTTTVPQRREARIHAVRWLRDQLRAEVMRGGFTGGLLPSEGELMAAYHAPRATVREALTLLRGEHLIERIQGTGTLAVAQRQAARLIEFHGVDGYGEAMLAAMSTRVLAMEIVPMPGVAARHLEEEPGTDCLLYEYVGYLYGQTLGVYTNYVRFPEADRLLTTPLRSSWFTLLRDAGLTIGDNELLIELLPADDGVAELADAEVGTPLLGMQQVIRDESGRPYDYAILRSRGDRISLMSRALRAHVNLKEDER